MFDQLADDPTPHQSPTLTDLEEGRAGVQLSRQLALQWLMALEDTPDVELLLFPAKKTLSSCGHFGSPNGRWVRGRGHTIGHRLP